MLFVGEIFLTNLLKEDFRRQLFVCSYFSIGIDEIFLIFTEFFQ